MTDETQKIINQLTVIRFDIKAMPKFKGQSATVRIISDRIENLKKYKPTYNLPGLFLKESKKELVDANNLFQEKDGGYTGKCKGLG